MTSTRRASSGVRLTPNCTAEGWTEFWPEVWALVWPEVCASQPGTARKKINAATRNGLTTINTISIISCRRAVSCVAGQGGWCPNLAGGGGRWWKTAGSPRRTRNTKIHRHAVRPMGGLLACLDDGQREPANL